MTNEHFTEIVRKAINVLFVSNPTGTSIGVLAGVVLDGLLGFFSPILKAVELINVSAIKLWHLIGLGVISVNLPAYLFRKRVDPSIRHAIDYIKEQRDKNNISDWQARQMYASLAQKVLESVTLESERQKQADRVNSLFSQPDSEGESNK